MNLFSVIIATTDGPVQVQRLAKEDPDVHSVICLNGTSEALRPISGAYDDFVRKPTGVIEREFGHPVYRMDISGRVSDGRSWQLGVFAAHFLHNRAQLAERTEDATHVLWLTGEVNNSLDVGTVEHVAEKLERSAEMLLSFAASGQQVILAFPRGNKGEVARGLAEKKTGLAMADIEQWPVVNTKDLTGALAPYTEDDQPGSTGLEIPVAGNTRAGWFRLAWVACALIVAVVGFAGWNMLGEISRWRAMAANGVYEKLLHDLETTKMGTCMTCRAAAAIYPVVAGFGKPGKRDIELSASELRAPYKRTCTSVRFAAVSPEERPVLTQNGGRFAASSAKGLCGLVYRLRNAGTQPFYGWLSVRVRSSKLARTSYSGGTEHALLAPGKTISVSVKIPNWLRSDVTYKVHAIADGVASEDVMRLMAGSSSRQLNAPGLGEWSLMHEVRLAGK